MKPRDAIVRAVLDGDLPALLQLDSQGTNVLLDEEPSALTALHLAAAAGRRDSVEFLLSRGADPTALRENKFSPLHAAAMNGHAEIVDILLRAEAAPNVQTDPQQYAPLHSAAWGGHTEVAAALLAAGAVPRPQNHRGETPARAARRNSHAPTADLIEAHVAEGTDYGPVITNFRWGHIGDSAGRTFKDARLYPCGAAEWDWRKTGTRHVPGIQIADVEDLLSTRPQTVILTRGVELALQVPDRTVQFVQNAGPSVLVLQTEAAVAEYNRRVRTERVVAIVHSTC